MIIENPFTHNTWTAIKLYVGSKVRNKLKIATSTKMSQRPLLNKKEDNSFFDFLLPARKAGVPDKKTKTGAQKSVIHLVRNKIRVVVCKFVGSELI